MQEILDKRNNRMVDEVNQKVTRIIDLGDFSPIGTGFQNMH